MKPNELEGQITFEALKTMEFTLDNLLEVGFVDTHVVLSEGYLFEYNHHKYIFTERGGVYTVKYYLPDKYKGD